MNITKLLKRNILAYKKELCILILLSIIYWISNITIPYVTGKFIDVLTAKRVELINNIILVLIALVVMEVLAGYFKQIVRMRYKERVTANVTYGVIEHIKRVPLLKISNENMSYLNSKISNDSAMSVALIIDYGFEMSINIITFLTACFIIGKTNISLLLFLFCLVPIYILLYFLFKNPISRTFKDFIDSQSKFFATQNEQLLKIKLIKISSRFDVFSQKSKEAIDNLVKAVGAHIKVGALFSNSSLTLNRIALIILFIFGGKEVINGNLTIGEFIIINTYFQLMLANLESFMEILGVYRKTTACLDRLEAIVALPIESIGNKQLKALKTIELRNLSFRYNENRQIFNDFNYKFEAGNVYTVLGSNGKGKSTLIDLLIGLIDSYEGNILFNNEEIKAVDLYKAREKLIGYTEQEPDLINGTLLENIYLNVDSPVDEDILNKYIHLFNLERFIESQLKGFDTYINTDSNSLSGGEKQKIAIIRTLLKNPDLIILDEPTSALDKISIENFKALIKELSLNKIIIIITHDHQLLDICDKKIQL